MAAAAPKPGGPAAPGGGGVPAGERDVHGRPAAARGGGVHEVVVHERAGLDQLQRGDGAQHRVDLRTVRVAARAPPAPPGEGRPDALAAAQHELAQVARGGTEGGVDGGGGRAAPVEEVRQRLFEADGQVQVGGVQAGLRRPSSGGAHGRGPAPGRGSAPGGREDTAPSVTAPLGRGAATRRRRPAPRAERRPSVGRNGFAWRQHYPEPGEGDRSARPAPARLLGRVLPTQGRGGRGRAVAGDPPARAAGPGVRVGHLRRRRAPAGTARSAPPPGSPPTPRWCRWRT